MTIELTEEERRVALLYGDATYKDATIEGVTSPSEGVIRFLLRNEYDTCMHSDVSTFSISIWYTDNIISNREKDLYAIR
ncbi:hypothetical protein NVP1031O_069 [Vibrio phage 1.031.O._10N.261.46.F8]|nr:hypothetical protein NVP1031O_069 [Vibrio phage 1.031.O._10N.261.46.F8]